MIVRCTNCNSAFAVKDEKVENKKFAFNCPNCSTENIVDNTKHLSEHQFADTGTANFGQEQVPPPSTGIATEEKFGEHDRADHFAGSAEQSFADQETSDLLAEDESFFLDEEGAYTEDLEKADEDESLSLEDFDADAIEMDQEASEPFEDLSLESPGLESDFSDETAKEDFTLEESLDDSGLLMDESTEPLPADLEEMAIEDALDLDIGSDIDVTEETDISDDMAIESLDDLKKEALSEGDSDDLSLDDIPVYDSESGEKDEEDLSETFDISFDEDEVPEAAQGTSDEILDEELLKDFEPLDESDELFSEDEIISLDESPLESKDHENIKAEEVYSKQDDEDIEDESITIDLDSLDIELEEDTEPRTEADDFSMEIPEAADEVSFDEPDLSMEEAEVSTGDNDEDITLDLDSLDIDLQEEDTISDGEHPEDIDIDTNNIFTEEAEPLEETLDDEDITLDLDSLDIPLDETAEIHKGEEIDEDEKLTLEDAGLTLEELTSDEIHSMAHEHDDTEEDIKLSIGDIDPSLNVEDIAGEIKEESILEGESESLVLEDFNDDDLPDIDFDSFEKEEITDEVPETSKSKHVSDEDLIDIDFDSDIDDTVSVRDRLPDTVRGGTVSFSIDYSLKYSRLSAVLRLVQMYLIGMIPHFLVFLLYSVLSLILGFINHIVVFTTRQAVEDFSEIQENTLRYFLSINSSLIGLVDEMPVFAGREDLDHPLQMSLTRPYKHSRILAALRLSVVGILFITLPHLLILGILSAVLPFIYIIGIISILLTGRWPYLVFDFLIRYYRHTAQVGAYIIGLIDKYPSFAFN